MSKYKVEFNQVCISSHRDPGSYGDWSESFDNSFRRITKVKDYADLTSIFDFKDGEKAYLVWLEYSSGDSFGHDEKSSVTAIGLFKDYKTATELKDKILADNKEKDHEYKPIKIETSDGQKFSEYPSWKGYFESLDNVIITEVTIGSFGEERFN